MAITYYVLCWLTHLNLALIARPHAFVHTLLLLCTYHPISKEICEKGASDCCIVAYSTFVITCIILWRSI